jgi:predicted nuclease of predicted toxin-antitoxin system
MRLLIDQNLPWPAAALLRQRGHDALSALEIGYDRHEDVDLIEFAVTDNRVIVTLDADFHEILAKEARTCPSVVLLRIHAPSAELTCELAHRACLVHESELLGGCLLTVNSKSMRLRKCRSRACNCSREGLRRNDARRSGDHGPR